MKGRDSDSKGVARRIRARRLQRPRRPRGGTAPKLSVSNCANQAAAACAQSGSNRQFCPARGALCEQQIGDIRTSDQKDKKDGAESHRNRPVQIGPHKQALQGARSAIAPSRSSIRRGLDQGGVDGLHSFAGLD